MNDYDLSDLQLVEERCLERALALGLDPPEILYHLVNSEEMYDIASRALPGRYSHWYFGQMYEQQKGAYDRGQSRIYELVINTRPAHAYLLEGNSFVSQTLVIAHVIGHCHLFTHNRLFQAADLNILSRVRAAAERIEEYMTRYGRTRVEDFLDACEAMALHAPSAQLGKARRSDPPRWKAQPYDELYPEEVARARKEVEAERAARRSRFPKHPEPDVLAFVAEHARHLDEWQRDIISIVRTEAAYFVPNRRTQVINEGFATLVHNKILHELPLETDQFWEYQALNAQVLAPRAGHPNPYSLGKILLEEVARLAEEPTDEERERWAWAGTCDGMEKVLEVITTYDDAALIAEFLTPEVCRRARLFAWEHPAKSLDKITITSREADEVRERLVSLHTNLGIPSIEIIDGDGLGRGELWLEHRHHGLGLDPEYAEGTLRHLSLLWSKPVVVHTIAGADREQPIWFRAEGEQVTRLEIEPGAEK